MGNHNGKYKRRSIRLINYDYSQSGAYFITICTHNREFLFGEIINGEMQLNELGKIVRNEWFRSTNIRNEIELYENEFVVMPNHIHGIVWIVDIEKNIVGATGGSPGGSPLQLSLSNKKSLYHQSQSPQQIERPHGPLKKSLSSFVAGYKSAVTKQINQKRQTPGIPVWQRNYYEHIIRNDDELNKIRQYIINNPLNWETDENNV